MRSVTMGFCLLTLVPAGACLAQQPVPRGSASDRASALVKKLAAGDEGAEAEAADGLARLGRPAVPLILEALGRKTADPRPLLQALGSMGPEAAEAVPALVEILEKQGGIEQQVLRIGAALTLMKVDPRGEKSSRALLRAAGTGGLASPFSDRDLGESVGEWLAGLGAPVAPGVVEALKAGDARLAAFACDLAARLGALASEATQPLSSRLADPDAGVREKAAAALAAIGPGAKAALPALERLFEDPEFGVRVQARYAQGRITGRLDETAAWFAGLLGADAEAFLLPGEDPAKALRRWADNRRWRVRTAMVEIGGPAVPALLRVLKPDLPFKGRKEVLETLGVLVSRGVEGSAGAVDAVAALDIDDRFYFSWGLFREGENLGQPWRGVSYNAGLTRPGPVQAKAMELLVTLLTEGSQRSAQLIRDLGHLGPSARPALDAILPLQAEEDESVRCAALEAIARLDPLRPDMAAALRRRIREKKDLGEAIRAATEMGPSARICAPDLLPLLDSPEGMVPAFKALVALGDPSLRPLLAKAVARNRDALGPEQATSFDQWDLQSREGAVIGFLGALADAGPCPEAVPLLLPLLSHEGWPVRRKGAETLSALGAGAPEAVGAFVRILADPAQWMLHDLALTALSKEPLEQERIRSLLPGAMADPDRETRKAAARILGEPAFRANAAQVLSRALADGSPDVRREVLRSLGRLGRDAKAVESDIGAAADSTDLDTRAWACAALASVSGDAAFALSRLVPLLKDPLARAEALEALSAMEEAAGAAVPSAAALLETEPWALRRACARTLGRIGRRDARAAEFLDRAMLDARPEVREESARALARIGTPGIEVLVRGLESPHHAVRGAAEKALAVPDSEVVAALRAVVEKGPPERRRRAAWILGRIGRASAPVLLGILRKGRPEAVSAVLEALQVMGREGSECIPDLVRAMASGDPAARVAASRALQGLGEAAAEALARALEGPDAAHAIEAAKALKEMGGAGAGAVPALRKALGSPDAKLRAEATRALGALGKPAAVAVEDLAARLSDPEIAVRRAAISALGSLGNVAAAATPSLCELLLDPSGDLRMEALNALLAIDPAPRAAVPALVEALKHRDAGIRLLAATTLGAIGVADATAVAGLAQAVSDKDEKIREAAVKAVASLGPSAAEALPALVRAASDSSGSVAKEALKAVACVGGRSQAALDALAGCMGDRREWVAEAAMEGLASMGKAAVPAIVGALRSERAELRERGAWALFNLGPAGRGAVPALLEALPRGSRGFRARAAMAFWRIGVLPEGARAMLVKDLKDADDLEGRRIASMAAGTADEAEAISILVERIAAGLADSRMGACLARFGPAALPVLVPLTGHEKASVRATAAFVLGKIAPPREEAGRSLVKLLGDPEPEVALNAVMSLSEIGWRCPGSAKAMVEAMPKMDPRFVEAILFGMRNLGEPRLGEAFAAAAGLLGSEREDLRAAALSILARADARAAAAVPALLDLAGKGNEQEQCLAALAVLRIAPSEERVVPVLERFLVHENRRVRDFCIEGVLDSGAERADAILSHALRCGDGAGRARFLQTLAESADPGRSPGPGVRSALLSLLADGGKESREPIVHLLLRLGREAAWACPAARRACETSEGTERTDILAFLAVSGGLDAEQIRAFGGEFARDPSTFERLFGLGFFPEGPVFREMLPALLPLMEDPAPSARTFVVNVASGSWSRCGASRRVVVKALADGSRGVRSAAWFALENRGSPVPLESAEEVEALLAGLRLGSRDEGGEAPRAPAWAGREAPVRIPGIDAAPEAAPAERLGGLLGDRSPEVRAWAARCLGSRAPEARSALVGLAKLQEDPDPRVKIWSHFALARLREDPGDDVDEISHFVKAFGGQESMVEASAAFAALGPTARGAACVLDHLMLDEERPSPHVFRTLLAVGGLDPRHARVLLSGLADPSDRFVEGVWIEGLVRLGEAALPLEEDVKALETHPSAQVRETWAPLLLCSVRGRGGERAAALADRLGAERGWKGDTIAAALAALGPRAGPSLPALGKILEGGDWRPIERAMRVLPAIGPQAVPVLARALADPRWWVRAGAARALGGMGAGAKAAVADLEKAAKDPDEDVRSSATRALIGVGPR